jgi:hypothetical protein
MDSVVGFWPRSTLSVSAEIVAHRDDFGVRFETSPHVLALTHNASTVTMEVSPGKAGT